MHLEPHNALQIRRADPGDVDVLVAFNRAMARETEGKDLPAETVTSGVEYLLASPQYGFYTVAARRERVLGTLMVTYEWSDWRNGLFWWIQSVYVEPAVRRQGIYRRLHETIREQARRDSGVCGLRLYVERDNRIAQRTYAALGMFERGYAIYEELLVR